MKHTNKNSGLNFNPGLTLNQKTKLAASINGIESISDPLKHQVTSTFILLPPYYFKTVLKKRGEFSVGFDSAVVRVLSYVCDVLGSNPGSDIYI